MVGNSVKAIAAGLVALTMFGAPAVGLAQGYRYDDQRSLAADCAPAQRSVVQPRRINRSAAQGSTVQYVERAPERTKTKTALMIAGSAAAGAGVGGAISGTKGALIGAAIGGGSASIYEAAKRR